MELLCDPLSFQQQCFAWRCQGSKTALVPTMGYLHKGHVSLLKFARQAADRVILSIFVNPTQFAPGEDLDRYPRDMDRDMETARAAGVDLVFTPSAEAMYPSGSQTKVDVPSMSQCLCGRSRPTHFCGVATVVCKLLILSLPNLAIFGEKDRQQLILIQRMARDLNLPTEIVGLPTVREEDGLAMSSRNVYLTPEERQQAPELYSTLLQAAELIKAGSTDVEKLGRRLRDRISDKVPLAHLEYLEFVNPDTLEPVSEITGPTILAAAMQLGKARLIDNIVLKP